jgi:hypothetical protein
MYAVVAIPAHEAELEVDPCKVLANAPGRCINIHPRATKRLTLADFPLIVGIYGT